MKENGKLKEKIKMKIKEDYVLLLVVFVENFKLALELFFAAAGL